MATGDHVFVRRGAYTHHGIDAGDGTVIHFAGKPGFAMQDARVALSTMEEFLRGGILQMRPHAIRLEPETIVDRARSRIGESGYSLFRNNCEHFATWASTGHGDSEQVKVDFFSALGVAAGVVLGAFWLRHH